MAWAIKYLMAVQREERPGIMIMFDESQLRDLCTEQSFQRGLMYFEEGRVKIREASSSRISATVVGTDDYLVEIDLDDLSANCSCPYDLEGYCKHIVAVFLAIDKEPEKVEGMRRRYTLDQESVDDLLNKTDPHAIQGFLLQEMKANPELRARFVARFSSVGTGKSLSEYRDDMESAFDEAEDEHGLLSFGNELNLSQFQELAEIYTQKEDFMEAAKIHQALSQTIAGRMNHVDDSYGYFSGEFSDSLKAFVECILAARLPADARRGYIDYLWGRYLLNKPDYFQDDYFNALKVLCTAREDLIYWKALVKPHLPQRTTGAEPGRREEHQARKLISMQLHLHSSLKENDGFYALMDDHYRASPDLCLQYARQLLQDGDREKAIKIAEEGTAIFPGYQSRFLREFLSESYGKDDPQNYREQLRSLYLLTGDWKYYDDLKKAFESKDMWQKTLENILACAAKERSGRTQRVEIYLRENMYDAALRVVIAKKSIEELRAYHRELADLYPKEYFGAYRELIYPFAGSHMGREHYRDVASVLKKMKKIAGSEAEFQEILARLLAENKRKPAFIDELKKM